MSDLEFAMAEDRSSWIQDRGGADILLWHSNHRQVCKDRSMITAKVRLVRIIINDSHRALRVVLNHDAVSIRRTLVFLVNIGVLILLSFVCRHERDFPLVISGKHLVVLFSYIELIIL